MLTADDFLQAINESLEKAGAFNHFSAQFVTNVVTAIRSRDDSELLSELPKPVSSATAIAAELALIYLNNHSLELSSKCALTEIRDLDAFRQPQSAIRTKLRYRSSTRAIHQLLSSFAVPKPHEEKPPLWTPPPDEERRVETVDQVSMRDLRGESWLSRHVKVTVIGATDVPRLDPLNSVDPFCELQLEGLDGIFRTSVQGENQNPVWNETFQFVHQRPDSPILSISLFDDDEAGDAVKLSELRVPLPQEDGIKEEEHQMTSVGLPKGGNIPLVPSLRLRFVTTVVSVNT
jgi:hypothetical protein